MKKLLFVVILFAGLFVGCGTKSDSEVKLDSVNVDTTSVTMDTTLNVDSVKADSTKVK